MGSFTFFLPCNALKTQTDKHILCCRNSDRVLMELDGSIRAMAVAELIALREQIRCIISYRK